MTGFAAARALIAGGVRDHAFPAAVIEIGRRDTVLWREAFGALTYDTGAAATETSTIFDLASLTKVISTATLVMQAVDRGTGYLPFFNDHTGRAEFEPAICRLALEYPPRSQSIYSDLGFMLLGFLLEDVGGAPLARQLEAITQLVAPEPLDFRPPRAWQPRVAPTEVDRWRGRLLVAEVHDENTWALGGAAGHAGLFGTVGSVGTFARLVLETLTRDSSLARRATLVEFTRRRGEIPGSSRALGWDTMLPTSSCGRRLSATAVGHTGFTGTSLWIDPGQDLYVALLTNRVHPTRENGKLKLLRPAIHDAIVDALR
jgi:CubicO group peptidase (beta-lactamase class C family)